ncbi:UDP-2,4-diacetamido-2,4,6-trideoxy-beta-L-altropyranose hydrolase [Marinomonas sp. A79]|uniref:UDP-2,4-diacetamido-2,4, 6-trideoxy-beta-L-altropyranose hydrolase n=1 Tax=Marinomonas vulgaris TaxID=2823372 RepID=A0ABS5H6V4_9GAMM|nr:UDP-2,4-diacetamido-2,4,6-trideoxy-beta-L-altropyranose hydrolase [Marinomonas vulgaris]MBR7887446.1 UDP-2,4-diacetamido-2,4,6-trideoxy-beta-L-altropyranose hydrolase [Marinomonas vulgaris]
MKALIRADASVDIGMGHRVRCQALAHAFIQLGWECRFIVDRRYQAFAATDDYLIDQEEECIALAQNADLVILDHYGYRADDITALHQAQPNLLVLDDMNDRGDFSAKWVLNPLHEVYSSQVENPLIGSQYALLRPEFLARSTQFNHASNQLLITLGGTDPLALTLPILQALKTRGFLMTEIQVLLGASAKNADAVKRFCQHHTIALAQGLSDVTPLMGQAKMAISAAGGTLFELACCGVPTIFAQVADNQTRSLQQHLPLGWCDSVRFDTLSEHERLSQVEALVEKVMAKWRDDTWQETARHTALSLVDSLGAERVARRVTLSM